MFYCYLLFSVTCFLAFICPTKEENVPEIPFKRKSCVCIPLWQCKEDLSGLDEDFNLSDITSRIDETTACSGYFDVCCKINCGISQFDTQNRIVGTPQTADFGEFPWMLGVLVKAKYKCGASLIHPKVALTAAHCVLAAAPQSYTVRAGEWHWDTTAEPLPHQDSEVEMIKIHPNFDPYTLHNDIALLVLKTPFQLSPSVGIICLPPKDFHLDFKRCLTSGWGRDSFKKSRFNPILKKITLPLVSYSKCMAILRRFHPLGPYFTLHNSFLCAGGFRRDTCKGDGGSPLVCPVEGQSFRYEQVGIVSWGLTCGLTESPGVYVNVIAFIEWIEMEMFNLDLELMVYNHK